MTATDPIILASGSVIRADILRRHGITFDIVKPGVDESIIKTEAFAAGIGLEETAMRLAEAKCMAVASAKKGFVIGSDQILEFDGRAYDKPASLAEAKARFLEMRGRTHSLINATVLAKDGEIIWRNLSRPELTLRNMTAAFIDDYLAEAGEEVLASVGAYQVEIALGLSLFERIDGDWFAVQGLAVYPLLREMSRRSAFGAAWANPAPVIAGVVGSPVSHSLSPLIHNEWARRACVDGEYRTFEVAPGYEAFAKAMDALRAEGVAGVNVTIPHKENALRYAASASDAAREIGAANMLTFTETGAVADNSDGFGFANSLKAALGPDKEIERALVLGAGGAARGVVAALLKLGCATISITNRTREKAEKLGEEFGLMVVDWDARADALRDCDLLVNTTSLGMTGQPPLDLELSALPDAAIVYDIVYAPLETPLLKTARERGAKTINGLEMLMHQAAPGFAAWFGDRPYPVIPRVDDALRDLLVAALKER